MMRAFSCMSTKCACASNLQNMFVLVLAYAFEHTQPHTHACGHTQPHTHVTTHTHNNTHGHKYAHARTHAGGHIFIAGQHHHLHVPA